MSQANEIGLVTASTRPHGLQQPSKEPRRVIGYQHHHHVARSVAIRATLATRSIRRRMAYNVAGMDVKHDDYLALTSQSYGQSMSSP